MAKLSFWHILYVGSSSKPIFEGDVDPTVPPTFEDGSTEKAVPGQGTYTIAPDGTVTFVPETGFVGQADGVTVIRKDRNGQTISAVYVRRQIGRASCRERV